MSECYLCYSEDGHSVSCGEYPEWADNEITRLRKKLEAAMKVVKAAGKMYTSLVPFTGLINTEPIPGIRSEIIASEGCFYTISEIRSDLLDALAALESAEKP